MSTTPLIPNNNAAKAAAASGNDKPTRFAQTLVNVLGFSRAGFGTACLVAPSLTLSLFNLGTVSSTGTIITRMFGGREIIIAAMTLAAERNRRAVGGVPAKEAVRRAAWFNAATDGLDVLVVAGSYFAGEISGTPLVMLLGAALFMVTAGVETAWGYA